MKVLYENNNYIVIVKESGVPSQPDKTGDIDVTKLLSDYLKSDVFVVHRLDRAVGGVMVYAKNAKTADLLTQQIIANEFGKTYFAVVFGKMEQDGELKNLLIKNSRLNITKVVNKGTAGAKEAILKYKTVATFADSEGQIFSLLEIELITGRHHQIRVQLSNAGFPIWGDTKYGKKISGIGFNKIALFAQRLSFYDVSEKGILDKKRKLVSFETELPDEYPFNQFVK